MPLPRGEHAWTGYYDRAGRLLFVITSKEARDFYFLYRVEGETYTKLGKSKNPLELVEKHGVLEAIRQSKGA